MIFERKNMDIYGDAYSRQRIQSKEYDKIVCSPIAYLSRGYNRKRKKKNWTRFLFCSASLLGFSFFIWQCETQNLEHLSLPMWLRTKVPGFNLPCLLTWPVLSHSISLPRLQLKKKLNSISFMLDISSGFFIFYMVVQNPVPGTSVMARDACQCGKMLRVPGSAVPQKEVSGSRFCLSKYAMGKHAILSRSSSCICCWLYAFCNTLPSIVLCLSHNTILKSC